MLVAWSIITLLGVSTPIALALTISKQIELDGIDYFVPPEPAWSLSPWTPNRGSRTSEYTPITVIRQNGTKLDNRAVEAILQLYDETDDVWTSAFTSALFIEDKGKVRRPRLASDRISLLKSNTILYRSDFAAATTSVAPGPYFLNQYTGEVFEAYRLYADTNQAFIQASYQDRRGDHTNLKAGTVTAGGLSIAVPSRLYYTPTPEKPLAGVRLAVKDNYDLKGMKTSGGSRALFEINPISNKTATPVQKLIDAGAIVVGKNKLSEFAFAGRYHLDHIDFLLPFNPRGDGYNSPGDSSGGSASAIASYDWLDVALGSDTGGSIRGPALANGIFGNRPSQGSVDLTGVLPLSTSMDTSGTFCRDPELWADVNKALYGGYSVDYPSLPRNVYITGFGVGSLQELRNSTTHGAIAYQFLQGISNLLGSNVTGASLDIAWNGSLPSNSSTGNSSSITSKPLSSIVSSLYTNLTSYEQWIFFGQPYLSRYQGTHNGELPYMTAQIYRGWMNARQRITSQTYQADLKLKQTIESFADWLFPPDSQSCTDSILIYPSIQGKFYKPDFDPLGVPGDLSSHDRNPFVQEVFRERDSLLTQVTRLSDTCATKGFNFRNTTVPRQEPNTPSSTSPGRFASVAGLPDFALTIGQGVLSNDANYSNRTQRVQTLPMGMNIIGRRGCDVVIQNLISVLHSKGIIKTVKTGGLAY